MSELKPNIVKINFSLNDNKPQIYNIMEIDSKTGKYFEAVKLFNGMQLTEAEIAELHANNKHSFRIFKINKQPVEFVKKELLLDYLPKITKSHVYIALKNALIGNTSYIGISLLDTINNLEKLSVDLNKFDEFKAAVKTFDRLVLDDLHRFENSTPERFEEDAHKLQNSQRKRRTTKNIFYYLNIMKDPLNSMRYGNLNGKLAIKKLKDDIIIYNLNTEKKIYNNKANKAEIDASNELLKNYINSDISIEYDPEKDNDESMFYASQCSDKKKGR